MFKIMGRRVTAEIVDIDQHKRTVAVIRCQGRDINHEMVVEGMAWAYRSFLQGAYASEYIRAENLARLRRSGIWRESNPLPPWEFRNRPNGSGKQRGRW
jgi:endonuclease YncB( thermonuclease family)